MLTVVEMLKQSKKQQSLYGSRVDGSRAKQNRAAECHNKREYNREHSKEDEGKKGQRLKYNLPMLLPALKF